jgi:hypothetical protein
MLRRTAGTLLVLVGFCSLSACQRMATAGLTPPLADSSTLPSEWGNLVSVSNSTSYPELIQLWFQDRAGNVRMVVFGLDNGKIRHVTLMRRQ